MPLSNSANAQTLVARSYLFVPGDRPDRFDKACSAGADMVIVDLEDAVAPENKAQARTAIMNWLSPDKTILLRINADTTPWFRDDLDVARAPGVAGIVLSKAEGIDDALRTISVEQGKFLLPQIASSRKASSKNPISR